MISLKFLFITVIFLTTVFSGFYPFAQKLKKDYGGRSPDFSSGESLAAGVFLGSGLMHMLADASSAFYKLQYDYPWPFFLSGVVFLCLLLLEHIGREIYRKEGAQSNSFSILAVCMLSFHSFLAGSALGISRSFSVMIVIFLAIVAHKWAASFSLSVQINRSSLTLPCRLSLFAVFAAMAPLGIIVGESAQHFLLYRPLFEPIFSSLAAGTFLYLGTLHGLEQGTLVKECCDLRKFFFVLLGFSIMAIVSIWT